MSKTSMTEGNFMGIRGGYDADDHNGHTGHGSTPEHAQEALETAQAEHTANGVYEDLGGVVFTGGGSDEE